MPEVDNNKNNAAEARKARMEKRENEKKIVDRAKKIHAARKAEETKKASEQRKARMEKREEERLKAEEVKKKELERKKLMQNKAVTEKAVEGLELVDFAITARKYKTQLTKKYLSRKFWEDPNPFDIHSYIPGTIVSLDVKEGDVVEEGSQLLILEAMKMQNRIDMPFTARIKKINVSQGERIPKDFLMVELEPIEK